MTATPPTAIILPFKPRDTQGNGKVGQNLSRTAPQATSVNFADEINRIAALWRDLPESAIGNMLNRLELLR